MVASARTNTCSHDAAPAARAARAPAAPYAARMHDPVLDVDALMAIAIDEARAALAHDDVPIGAVVARVADGTVVARAHNERELRRDPTAHAEVLALRAAAAVVESWRLNGLVLVSTIEPCPMCAGAAWAARV